MVAGTAKPSEVGDLLANPDKTFDTRNPYPFVRKGETATMVGRLERLYTRGVLEDVEVLMECVRYKAFFVLLSMRPF